MWNSLPSVVSFISSFPSVLNKGDKSHPCFYGSYFVCVCIHLDVERECSLCSHPPPACGHVRVGILSEGKGTPFICHPLYQLCV